MAEGKGLLAISDSRGIDRSGKLRSKEKKGTSFDIPFFNALLFKVLGKMFGHIKH